MEYPRTYIKPSPGSTVRISRNGSVSVNNQPITTTAPYNNNTTSSLPARHIHLESAHSPTSAQQQSPNLKSRYLQSLARFENRMQKKHSPVQTYSSLSATATSTTSATINRLHNYSSATPTTTKPSKRPSPTSKWRDHDAEDRQSKA